MEASTRAWVETGCTSKCFKARDVINWILFLYGEVIFAKDFYYKKTCIGRRVYVTKRMYCFFIFL